jgi:hypothetical protein
MHDGLLMRAPSPRGGEGWDEGAPAPESCSEWPAPLTPPSPQWGEGEESIASFLLRRAAKGD